MAQNQSQRPFVGGQLSQFDLVLMAIPLALVAGFVTTFLVSVPLFAGVTLGAAVAGSLIGYGIYAISKPESTPYSSAQIESTPYSSAQIESTPSSERRLDDHVQRAD